MNLDSLTSGSINTGSSNASFRLYVDDKEDIEQPVIKILLMLVFILDFFEKVFNFTKFQISLLSKITGIHCLSAYC